MELALNHGVVVTPHGQFPASIGIDGGRIATIEAAPITADQTIDLGGLHVLPGLIDAHTHLRDPGLPELEDFDTGTAAAAAGGFTMVLEMPNADVGTSSADLLTGRAATVKPRARVDFGLFAGASHQNLDDIPGLARAGAVAFKTFLIQPYPGRAVNFSRCWVENDAQLLQAFRAVASTGLVAAVHCENQSIIEGETARLKAEGRVDPLALFDSRPSVAEIDAVSRAVLLAREAGAPLHVVHLTTAEALAVIGRARAAGQRVTAEATPPHLFFTRDAVNTQGPYGLHIPPLRLQPDVDALWEGLRNGMVDFVATDHAPFVNPQDKDIGWQDPWLVRCGEALLESVIPLLLDAVSKARLTLSDLVRICSESPARVYGLFPQKGAIQPGSDADLTVVDLGKQHTIDASRFYSKGGPLSHGFDGWECKGAPVLTMVRGKVIMRDGVVMGEPGWGEWVRGAAARHG